jgi:hypothetical protein
LTIAPSGGSAAQNGSCRPGQVDDAGDAAVGHDGRYVGAAGHVQLVELQLLVVLVFGPALGDKLEPVQVRAQVGGHHRHALVEQQPHDPGADAACRTGDQEPLG